VVSLAASNPSRLTTPAAGELRWFIKVYLNKFTSDRVRKTNE
jgi:hypothetical protein